MKISGYRLDEILAERRHIGPVCAAAQGLYAELCRQYNKFPDPAGFECRNSFLEGVLFCSENSLDKYRAQLITAGVIDFLSRKEECKPGIYRILDLGKPAGTTSNFEVDNQPTTSKFEDAVNPTTSKFEVDNTQTTSKFEVVPEETEMPTTSNFEVVLPQNLRTSLNKSKLGSTNVLPLSPKKGAAKISEDSSFPETSFPKIPTVTDPFEAFELPPAAPPFCAPPPQAEMPAEDSGFREELHDFLKELSEKYVPEEKPEMPAEKPTAAPAKTKRQPSPKFQKPTHQELEAYFQDRRQEWPAATCKDEAETFFDHYTSNGWKVGTAKTPMQDWQAAVRNWLKRTFSNARTNANSNGRPPQSAGSPKTGAAGPARSRSGTIASIQARKHGTGDNSAQRAEFTDAEIVD